MGDQNQRLSIADLRSGRNNVDPPSAISETHCVEAVNVDWFNATFARKRAGVTAVTTTGSPFTGQIYSSLFRHVPGTDETAAELWATDDTPGIAFDAATDSTVVTATSLTWSHSCLGVNRILFVHVIGDTALDAVTGVTYNGVAMTQIAKVQQPAGHWTYLYDLVNPASGANNVVVSASSSIFLAGASISYTGAKQSGQPDNSVTTTNASAASLSTTLTPVASSCWTIMVGDKLSVEPTSSTGTVRLSFATTGSWAIDSNNAVAGSTTLTASWVTPVTCAAIMASFAPAVTSGPHLGRLTGGNVWIAPTLKDAPTGNGWDFSYASLNGKLFIAYQSAVNRLHVWDPVSNSVRRTGLAVMVAPTGADTGVGTYAAVLRYYRTRATEQRSGVTVRRSEPSASLTFTPSGTGTGVVVTQGTPPSEGETHWEVEASLDNLTFYRIATVVIATTTYTDSATISTYSSNPLSDVTGTYGLQKSYRSIAADQGRLLGFGSYTSTDSQNRVEFSAVIGSLLVTGDEERVPLNNFVGLDEKDSGAAVAIKGPINGSFFALKYRQTWKLTPTGSTTVPYNTIKLSPTIGAISMHAVTVGEDEGGNSTLYWMSPFGPYRFGTSALEYIGKPVEDKTLGSNGGSSLNLAALHVVAHTRWIPLRRQMWFWVATGSNNDPDTLLCFSLGRLMPFYGGYNTESGSKDSWSIFTDGIATARCSALFSGTIGASMSRDLFPYIGSTATTNTLGKADSGTQDLGANYQGYITTRAYNPWTDGYTGTILGAMLLAKTATGVSIQMSTIRDYGIETVTDTCSLTAVGAETRVQPRFGSGVTTAGMETVQFTVGDAAAANTSWQIDALNVTWKREGPVVA